MKRLKTRIMKFFLSFVPWRMLVDELATRPEVFAVNITLKRQPPSADPALNLNPYRQPSVFHHSDMRLH